jgi:hypothetical protein
VIDASPAAITLAPLLTDEELDSLEKRAGHGEIAGRGRPGGSNVASPQPDARHGDRTRAAVPILPDRACLWRVLGRGPQEPSALIHAQPVPQADPFGGHSLDAHDPAGQFRRQKSVVCGLDRQLANRRDPAR